MLIRPCMVFVAVINWCLLLFPNTINHYQTYTSLGLIFAYAYFVDFLKDQNLFFSEKMPFCLNLISFYILYKLFCVFNINQKITIELFLAPSIALFYKKLKKKFILTKVLGLSVFWSYPIAILYPKQTNSRVSFFKLIWLFLACSNKLYCNDIVDYDEDKEENVITIATVLGIEKTHLMININFIIQIFITLLNKERIEFVILPFFNLIKFNFQKVEKNYIKNNLQIIFLLKIIAQNLSNHGNNLTINSA